MDSKLTLSMAFELLCGLIFLYNVEGLELYPRLEGLGCDKLNVISDDLNCTSEGNYSMAGVCDRFVRCTSDAINNSEVYEPHMVFCDTGENYVNDSCTAVSDPHDCPQSHCRWTREDTPRRNITSSQAKLATNVSEENPRGINQTAAINLTSNEDANLKCNKNKANLIPRVKLGDPRTCPWEGRFFLFSSEETIDCNMFVMCMCKSEQMGTYKISCGKNKTFNGKWCTNYYSEETMCRQKICSSNETQQPVYYSYKCPSPSYNVVKPSVGSGRKYGFGMILFFCFMGWNVLVLLYYIAHKLSGSTEEFTCVICC